MNPKRLYSVRVCTRHLRGLTQGGGLFNFWGGVIHFFTWCFHIDKESLRLYPRISSCPWHSLDSQYVCRSTLDLGRHIDGRERPLTDHPHSVNRQSIHINYFQYLNLLNMSQTRLFQDFETVTYYDEYAPR
jgi:hypothetical protein